jgi:hypothetical protein
MGSLLREESDQCGIVYAVTASPGGDGIMPIGVGYTVVAVAGWYETGGEGWMSRVLEDSAIAKYL